MAAEVKTIVYTIAAHKFPGAEIPVASRYWAQNKVVVGITSDFSRQTELSCECVKLVGKRHAFALPHELAFANHMHQFDAGQDRQLGRDLIEMERDERRRHQN